MMEEIELNFQLDEHGRTATTTLKSSKDSTATSEVVPSTSSINYDTHTLLTNLTPPITETAEHQKWLDDLLFDCQISDSGLMPRTFWIPSSGMTPRCYLEQIAFDIFHHHIPKDFQYDINTSGAEWWTQIRPSPPKTGRYSMHDGIDPQNQDQSQSHDMSKNGISFHWDKDEDLRELTGGTTYIHPHLSTVTYLTNLGAPTLALNRRIHPLTGEWISSSSIESIVDEGFLSWPKTGKHLCFDGRFLHVAPIDLMESGVWERQLKIPSIPPEVSVEDDNDDEEKESRLRQPNEKLLQRRHRHITFLANIWLNYKPYNIQPFPSTMIDKMSGHRKNAVDEEEKQGGAQRMMKFSFLESEDDHDSTATTTSTSSTGEEKEHKRMTDDITVVVNHLEATTSSVGTTTVFTWPMGDCDSQEYIDVHIPVDRIRKQAIYGGNSRIRWENVNSNKDDSDDTGVRLYIKTSKEKRKLDDDDSNPSDPKCGKHNNDSKSQEK